MIRRDISTSIEYVGGPDCGQHAVIAVQPNGLPPLLPDRHGEHRYHATGRLTGTRRHRYDWHAEHTGRYALPTKCCDQPHRGCPLFLHRPGSTA